MNCDQTIQLLLQVGRVFDIFTFVDGDTREEAPQSDTLTFDIEIANIRQVTGRNVCGNPIKIGNGHQVYNSTNTLSINICSDCSQDRNSS